MVLHLKKKNTRGLLIKDKENVELDVSDINQAARFYSRNLGFEILFIFSDMGILRRPEEEISLLSVLEPEGNNLKLKLSSKKEFEDLPRKFNATGVKILKGLIPGENECSSMTFQDPDGNQIEIVYQS